MEELDGPANAQPILTVQRATAAFQGMHKRGGENVTFGSLFAGIGGFDLGFERAGMRCVWQVEIDPYCRRVLAKHWPNVRRHDDVRTWPTDDAERPDVICGGFPCQDISNAGLRAGITGERSGLWTEYARIIRVLRPRFVVVENVSALLDRGMDTVLGTLAELGYDAEWEGIPAAAFGAPIIRERVFILAFPRGDERIRSILHAVNDPKESRRVAQKWGLHRVRFAMGKAGCSLSRQPWMDRPASIGVVDGIPSFVEYRPAIKSLGNSIVPQVAEWIGCRLMEYFTEA